jgi:hypothetical protein
METGMISPNFVNQKANPKENIRGASVSPDGSWLTVSKVIFEEVDKFNVLQENLLLMTPAGEIVKVLPWQKEWTGDPVWLDDQHLVIVESLVSPQNIDKNLAKPMILNPFTGDQQLIASDFPDIFDGYRLVRWDAPWYGSFVVYNKTLTRAVYLSGERGVYYVLRDIQKGKELLVWTQFEQFPQNQPRWSPDGLKFLMFGILGRYDAFPDPLVYKFYLVDNNGNVSEIKTGLLIDDYFWSPTGRYIAIFSPGGERQDGYLRSRLSVFDTQTQKAVDTCFEFTPFTDHDVPIWSPDEAQILIRDTHQVDIYNDRRERVILVDLVKGIAFPLAEDMLATGWLKSP